MQNSHNVGDCHKYKKDGTLKKAFAEKSMQCKLHNKNVPRKHNTSYVQLSGNIAKLKKSNKKLKPAKRSASAIVTLTMTAMTLIHPEMMGPIALGSEIILVQNVIKLIIMLTLTPV